LHQKSTQGAVLAVGAYGLWGLIPLYFKLVADIAPVEVLAHRMLWSFVVLAVVLTALQGWGGVAGVFRERRLVLILATSAVLLALNWLTFIYAVASEQVLQSSLGYFLNPLVTVLLGVVFLGERLTVMQKLAVALAAVGVLVFVVAVGQLPWIALVLAVTFSFYGLLHKTMPVGSMTGVTMETLILMPLGLGYVVFLHGAGANTAPDAAAVGLLSLSGLATAAPLVLFAAAARRLRLSTLGMVQYLTPSLQFLLAVVAFKEPFSTPQLVSFLCIWTAIALYTADSVRSSRPSR